MANVETDGKCTIFPARPSLPQKCKLTYSDLRMLSVHYTQKCLLFSAPTGWSIREFESMVERLKKSLSETLVYFYPMAGRLETCDGEVFIKCNDSGVEFTKASALDLGLAQVMVDSIPHQLIPFNGVFSTQGQFLPLLAVQVFWPLFCNIVHFVKKNLSSAVFYLYLLFLETKCKTAA